MILKIGDDNMGVEFWDNGDGFSIDILQDGCSREQGHFSFSAIEEEQLFQKLLERTGQRRRMIETHND